MSMKGCPLACSSFRSTRKDPTDSCCFSFRSTPRPAGGCTGSLTSAGRDDQAPRGACSRPCFSVGTSGFSYEEAAAICESAVETIKSRVNRARTRLSKLLSIDSPTDSAQIKRRVPF